MLLRRLWSLNFCRHKLLSTLQKKESSKVTARVYGWRFDPNWRWFVEWRAAFIRRREFDCNFGIWNKESSAYQRSKRHQRYHFFKMPQFFTNKVQLRNFTPDCSPNATRSFRRTLNKPSIGLKKKTAGFWRHYALKRCRRVRTSPRFILEDPQMNDLCKLLFWIHTKSLIPKKEL